MEYHSIPLILTALISGIPPPPTKAENTLNAAVFGPLPTDITPADSTPADPIPPDPNHPIPPHPTPQDSIPALQLTPLNHIAPALPVGLLHLLRQVSPLQANPEKPRFSTAKISSLCRNVLAFSFVNDSVKKKGMAVTTSEKELNPVRSSTSLSLICCVCKIHSATQWN